MWHSFLLAGERLPLHFSTLLRVKAEQTLEHQSDLREHDMSDTLLRVILLGVRNA